MNTYVDNPFESPVILSLCPGVLGLERGLERAIGPVRVAAYVEIEAFIIANLVAAMEQGVLASAPVWSDIKTFDGAILRGKIQGIIGGYPCQPFSNAGARNGTGDPRHLYPFISGIIEAAGPLWCFFENVEGHLTLGYPEVSADLRSMGYAVEAEIYSAEEVGAPHQRDRLFILAIKQEWLENANKSGVRGWYYGVAGGEERAVEITGSSRSGNEMADTPGGGIGGLPKCEPGQERSEQRNSANPDGGSEKMGNPTSEGQQECGYGNFSKLQTENGKRIYDRPEQPGITEEEQCTPPGRHLLADTEGPGLERCITEGNTSTGGCAGEYDAALTGHRWPARPGEEQYGWEEPRVKSRLGSTINGYNFREDLLRAYGNSVVEQTAEIAFIDLLGKHLKNNGINQ